MCTQKHPCMNREHSKEIHHVLKDLKITVVWNNAQTPLVMSKNLKNVTCYRNSFKETVIFHSIEDDFTMRSLVEDRNLYN